ncbi:type II toxin -antitoxin system TacA 1-like antitoxin [Acinetobacter sp. ANC 4640]
MNEDDKAFEQAQQRASETAALTKQDQIQLSDAAFEHLQQLVNTPPAVSGRLKQAAQLLEQEGL